MKIILKPDDVIIDIGTDVTLTGCNSVSVSTDDETLILCKTGDNEYTTEDKRFVVIDPFETEPGYFVHIYKRINGIPETIAVTDRLIIRETTEDDAVSFAEIYKDPKARRFGEEIADGLYIDREWIREYRKNVYELTDTGIWSVILKETGEVIGRAGFTIVDGVAEIGYLIAATYRRKGYGKEAVNACIEAAKERGIKKIRAVVDKENKASIALLENLGFIREACEKDTAIYISKIEISKV